MPALGSSAEFAAAIASPSHLVLVDAHGWAGPCLAVEPIFRKLFIELERLDARLKCYTVDEAVLSAEQKSALPPLGAKPLFLIYKQCVLLAKISGVSAPELEATIVDNLPALPAEAS